MKFSRAEESNCSARKGKCGSDAGNVWEEEKEEEEEEDFVVENELREGGESVRIRWRRRRNRMRRRVLCGGGLGMSGREYLCVREEAPGRLMEGRRKQGGGAVRGLTWKERKALKCRP